MVRCQPERALLRPSSELPLTRGASTAVFSNLFSGSAHPFPESLGGVAGGASAGTLMAVCVTASSARPASLLTVAALASAGGMA